VLQWFKIGIARGVTAAIDCGKTSEIVVPLIRRERLLGVLDVDSPLPCRFDENDELGLEKIAEILVTLIYPEDNTLGRCPKPRKGTRPRDP
jgi:putative methionine-R-sulfoxide reductase with GAF domain